MRDRMLVLGAVVAFMIGAAPEAEARHGGHAAHKSVNAHKLVRAPAVRAPVVAAPVVAAPMVHAPVAVPVAAVYLPIATVIGAPVMAVVPVAVTSAAVLPAPSYTGHAAVTTGLVPAALGSPLLLSPAPPVPQKQVDYCCGRI